MRYLNLRLALLASVIGCLALTPAAEAHTLTPKNAGKQVKKYAKAKVDRSPEYGRYKYYYCESQFPHRVNCRVAYYGDGDEAKQIVCKETLTAFYRPHSLVFSIYVVIDRHTVDCQPHLFNFEGG